MIRQLYEYNVITLIRSSSQYLSKPYNTFKAWNLCLDVTCKDTGKELWFYMLQINVPRLKTCEEWIPCKLLLIDWYFAMNLCGRYGSQKCIILLADVLKFNNWIGTMVPYTSVVPEQNFFYFQTVHSGPGSRIIKGLRLVLLYSVKVAGQFYSVSEILIWLLRAL